MSKEIVLGSAFGIALGACSDDGLIFVSEALREKAQESEGVNLFDAQMYRSLVQTVDECLAERKSIRASG